MSNPPNNPCVFNAALAGSIAGIAASGNYFNGDPGDSAYQAAAAFAMANELDSVFGAGSYTDLQIKSIQSCCQAVWQTRSALGSNASAIPSSYAGLAGGIVALVNAANTVVVNAGINPNSCTAGAGGGLISSGVFQDGAAVALSGGGTSLIGGAQNITIAAGQKLVMWGTATFVYTQESDEEDDRLELLVDGSVVSSQTTTTSGNDFEFNASVNIEVSVLSVGTHTVNLVGVGTSVVNGSNGILNYMIVSV